MAGMNMMNECDRLFRLTMTAFNCAGHALSRGDVKTFYRGMEKARQYWHKHRRAAAEARRALDTSI